MFLGRGETEQEVQKKILPEHINLRSKSAALSVANNFKKSRQVNRSAIKRTVDLNSSGFDRDENKRRFDKYNSIDAYIKTRLAKIDGQNSLKILRDLKGHGDYTKNNLDSQNNRLNGSFSGKLRLNSVQNKIETKQSKNETQETKVKRDIIAENITKQGKKLCASPMKRIPATSNFVYEFNPFVNAEHSNSSTSQIHSWSTNKSDQKLLCAKTGTTSFPKSTLSHNADFAKQKLSTLPKLNSRFSFVTDDPNITNSTQDTCLPVLSKEELTKTLSKQLDDKYKQNDIDREVENVKSTWQALRAEKDWTKGKDCFVNVRTKKLYEMLEKVTYEIDKVQRKYMDPSANHYLHRSATNVFKANSKPSLKEDAEAARSIIFPKKEAKIKMKVSRLENIYDDITNKEIVEMRFNEVLENISLDKQPTESLSSSKYAAIKRSTHDNAQDTRNTNDSIKSIYTNASNIYKKKQNTIANKVAKSGFRSNSERKVDIRSSIEEYVRRYYDKTNKLRDIEEKKEMKETIPQEIIPSTNDIADILASLDIESLGLYEDLGEHNDTYDTEECASEEDEKYHFSNTNATRIMSIDNTRENSKIYNEFSENTEVNSDVQLKNVDTKSSGILGQSITASCEDNAFIKIGLNVLDKNLSKDKLSQILQSKYLKKNLSLQST